MWKARAMYEAVRHHAARMAEQCRGCFCLSWVETTELKSYAAMFEKNDAAAATLVAEADDDPDASSQGSQHRAPASIDAWVATATHGEPPEYAVWQRSNPVKPTILISLRVPALK